MARVAAAAALCAAVARSQSSSAYSDFTPVLLGFDTQSCNVTQVAEVTIGGGCVPIGAKWVRSTCVMEDPSKAELWVCTDESCVTDTCVQQPAITRPMVCGALDIDSPSIVGAWIRCDAEPNSAAAGAVSECGRAGGVACWPRIRVRCTQCASPPHPSSRACGAPSSPAVGVAVTLAIGVVVLCAAWVMRDKKAAKANAAASASTVSDGYSTLPA